MARFLNDLAASGLRLEFEQVRRYEDLAPAFERMARRRFGGLAVAQSLLTGLTNPRSQRSPTPTSA